MVEQIDRDAAAESSPHNARWYGLVRAGALDNDPLVQAFAAHRAAERARILAADHMEAENIEAQVQRIAAANHAIAQDPNSPFHETTEAGDAN